MTPFDNNNPFDLLDTQGLLALPSPQWLVKGVIPDNGFIGLYGPPSSYKSFVALDLALSISQGIPWLGRYPTQQAPVIYVAAEGGSGIKQRVRAWMGHHNFSHSLEGAYFRLRPLHVRDEGVVEGFLEFLDNLDMWPGLIVLDTLSRCFGGGEENASDDMAQFVERVTALAKGRFMASLVLHHTNATGQRERGHTSFRGAADTMFKCVAIRSPKGDVRHITVTNDKQKDSEELEPIYLKPRVYIKPQEITGSVVLEPIEVAENEKASPKAPAPMRKQDMLSVLESHPEGLTTAHWLTAAKTPQSTGYRRIGQLKEAAEIYQENGRWFAQPSVTDLAQLGIKDDSQ